MEEKEILELVELKKENLHPMLESKLDLIF